MFNLQVIDWRLFLMKFFKGIMIGGLITTGVLMMYNEKDMFNKKKMMKQGKKMAKKLGIM